MKVVLEASPLLHPKTGIGRYTWELAKYLESSDTVASSYFYARGQIYHSLDNVISAQVQRRYPVWSKPWRLARRMYNHWRAKYYCRQSVVHGPNYFLPPCTENGIITVHDLSIYRYPETHPIERIQQFEKYFESSLKRATHIITDSVAMEQELIDILGWPQEKISVVPLGVSSEFTPLKQESKAFLTKYSLQLQGYVLCVSTIEPRKNIDRLLKAYSDLPIRLRQRYPLVMIGGEGWLADSIMTQINKGVLEGWVIRPGYVSEEELILFYQHARFFVYPSEYEGFGLPVAEAMACGIPTVISNRTSLPEVAQGCGMIIEPHDHLLFRDTIEKALCDEHWRLGASKGGLSVVAEYTWEKCAEETIQIYSKVGRNLC